MYNEFTHNLSTLELPNIIAVSEKSTSTGQGIPTSSHPDMVPLITKLATLKPKWTFFGSSFSMVSGVPVARKFEVWVGGQQLGVIDREYDFGKSRSRFCIYNHRIRSSRRRGSYAYTTNADRAVKMVMKNFYERTASELVREGVTTVSQAISREMSDRRGELYRTQSAMINSAMNFVLDEMRDSYRAFLEKNRHTTELSALADYDSVKKSAEDITPMQSSNGGYAVIIDGNQYLVSDFSGGPDTPKYFVYTDNVLTDHFRRCIGMLKIAPDNTVIPGIGYRVTDTTFYVVQEPKTEEGDATQP